MAVLARMKCVSTTKRSWLQADGVSEMTVELTPVLSEDDDDPNKSFSKYTPSGKLELQVTNPDAFDQFEAGVIYNIEIRKHTPSRRPKS